MTYFGVVIVIDIEHRLILHPVSIVGLIVGLAYGTRLHGLANTLTGGVIGYAAMLGFYYLGKGYVYLYSKLRGPLDEVALGFGDVNLSGVIGLLLGWPGIGAGLIFTLLLSGFAGMVVIVVAAIRRQYRPDIAMPYGPFLVTSTIFLLFLKKIIFSIWSLL